MAPANNEPKKKCRLVQWYANGTLLKADGRMPA